MITQDEWHNFIKTLRTLNESPEAAHDETTMKGLIAKLYKKNRKQKRLLQKNKDRQHDRAVKESTLRCTMEVDFAGAIRPPSIVSPQQLKRATKCYCCKGPFTEVDRHYHALCPNCACLNHQWRQRQVNLKGRRFLLSGGRVKIGYHAALRLLRCGAEVLITTRFPNDAKTRFRQEDDYSLWNKRLKVYGLDLRDLQGIKSFVELLIKQGKALDGIINNAAQTVRRPDAYFRQLIKIEKESDKNYSCFLENRQKLLSSDEVERFFPKQTFDSEGLPVDLRNFNSWLMTLE